MPVDEIGKVDRLVLFAGPAGAGKSTFLEAPDARLARESIPEHLSMLHSIGPDYLNLGQVRLGGSRVVSDLLVHVDMTNPLRWMERKPTRWEELLERIPPDLFHGWKELNDLARRTRTADVVTLFVRREEHFSRWTGRGLDRGPDGSFAKLVTLVNGDSTNNSELHRKLYRAWHDWVLTLSPRSSTVLDGNREKYRFVGLSDFEAEIDDGYEHPVGGTTPLPLTEARDTEDVVWS